MWPGRPQHIKNGGFPAPANASALWDAAYGITLGSPTQISAWTDRIGGRVVSQAVAAQRPLWQLDAGGSNLRKVVQCNVANQRFLNVLSLANPTAYAGDYAYAAYITRQRALANPTNPLQTHVLIDGDNTPAVRSAFSLTARSDGGSVEYWYYHRNSAGTGCDYVSGDIQDTKVHFWELTLDATAGTQVWMDGALVSTIASTAGKAPLATNHINVWVGSSSPYMGDVSFDIILECRSKPTAAERAAMLQWARSVGGVT